MQKKLFSIEWPDEYGSAWMNVDNLRSYMEGEGHIGPNIELKIRDVTIPPKKVEPVQGGHDF